MPFQKHNPHGKRFSRGKSGNPGGTYAGRAAFAEAFYQALTTNGTPAEAADLLWKSARKGQPWAVALLLSRLAPEMPAAVKLDLPMDAMDYSRLTDDELITMGRILERAEQAGASILPGSSKELPQ
jgi:hypothetical protein